MRKLITILFFIPFLCNAQIKIFMIPTTGAGGVVGGGGGSVDSVTWNFSLAANPQTGCVNLFGDPYTGVRTSTASNGWGISTVATANWSNYSSSCAIDNIYLSSGGSFVFPSNAFKSAYYQYSSTNPGFDGQYNVAKPQFIISGLNSSHTYTIYMSGSEGGMTFGSNPVRFRVAGATSPASQDLNEDVNPQTAGVTFTVAPDVSGNIKVWVNTVNPTVALALISGLKIKG
jgi:hypothetical protein